MPLNQTSSGVKQGIGDLGVVGEEGFLFGLYVPKGRGGGLLPLELEVSLIYNKWALEGHRMFHASHGFHEVLVHSTSFLKGLI